MTFLPLLAAGLVTSTGSGLARSGLAALTPVLVYAQLVLGAALRHTGAGLSLDITGALLTSMTILWTAHRVLKDYRNHPEWIRSAPFSRRLVEGQILLGTSALYMEGRGLLAPVHVGLGALPLPSSLLLRVRTNPWQTPSGEFIVSATPLRHLIP